MRSVDTQAVHGAITDASPGKEREREYREEKSGERGQPGQDRGAAASCVCDNIIITTTMTTGGDQERGKYRGRDCGVNDGNKGYENERRYSLDDRSSPSPIPHFPDVLLVSLQIIFTMSMLPVSLLLRLSPPLDT